MLATTTMSTSAQASDDAPQRMAATAGRAPPRRRRRRPGRQARGGRGFATALLAAAVLAAVVGLAVPGGVAARRIRRGEKQLLRRSGFTPLPLDGDVPVGTAGTGTLHHCSFTGPAVAVEQTLSQRQLHGSAELYYGKKRDASYFQHLFVHAECTNGLPDPEKFCLSSLRVGQHCGPDEDWSVIAPDEFDGPGVMWRNEEPCDPGTHETNVTVAADFFCPNEEESIHLHRCSFDGEPAAISSASAKLAGRPNKNGGDVNSNADASDLADGYFEHVFLPEECSNGLPPVASGNNPHVRCVTSLRWAESCGGDHDWEAISPEEGAAAVRWYTSHGCDQARVAVDYFCSPGPAGTDMPRRLHRCNFRGQSDTDPDSDTDGWCHFHSPTQAWGKERHAGDPAPGFCLHHKFTEGECTNGLPKVPQGSCLATMHRARECGAEQDWRIVGPADRKTVDALQQADTKKAGAKAEAGTIEEARGAIDRSVASVFPAGMVWHNALDTGPCGDAHVTVDFYCPTECVRQCQHGGALDAANCKCACDGSTWWTGVECEVCGAEATDCDASAGQELDKHKCECVAIGTATTTEQAAKQQAEADAAAAAAQLKAVQSANVGLLAAANGDAQTKGLEQAKAQAMQTATLLDNQIQQNRATSAVADAVVTKLDAAVQQQD